MKRLTQALIVAIGATMAAIVQADNGNPNGGTCSEATLDGLYVFGASGVRGGSGVAQPRAVVEFIRFNGDGTLSVPASTANINGAIFRGGGPGQAGTYVISSNCTGSLAFGPPGPTFDLYVAPSGSEVHMMFTGGPVPVLVWYQACYRASRARCRTERIRSGRTISCGVRDDGGAAVIQRVISATA
jgi:hypothetical protein